MLWRTFGMFGSSGIRALGIAGVREIGTSGIQKISNSEVREFGSLGIGELMRTSGHREFRNSDIRPTSFPEKIDCHRFGTPQVCRATATRK